MAGLRSVPVILREATEAEALQLALVENIQREDLNPLETARALRALSEEFGLSQEELAQRLGKDRSSVANYLRLLRLPEDVQALLEAGRLQMGHARALLGLPSAELQRRAAQAVLQEGLSVRRTEALVRRALSSVSRKATIKPKKRTIVSKSDPNIQTLQEQLSSHLGLRVRLQHRAPGGVVEIHYSSLEELQGLLQRLLS
jgi:ParB family chromosome partitioning protein